MAIVERPPYVKGPLPDLAPVLKTGDISEIDQGINRLMAGAQLNNPDASPLEVYRIIAGELKYVDKAAREAALNAAQDKDP